MIHIVIGTKAQLIKMAPIMKRLEGEGIDYNYIYTGQHQATLAEIHENFQISRVPNHTLYVGDDITSIGQMARWVRKILREHRNPQSLKKLFLDDSRGIVLNHGDTFSTLLGSYLARKVGLKTGHVESGLRSFNLFHPFPEELTRLATFSLTDYYFAPGDWAISNLRKYDGAKINTGVNTMYDSLQFTACDSAETSSSPYAIVSVHRFENIFLKRRLKSIVDSLIKASQHIPLRFILHKPTEKKLQEFGLFDQLARCDAVELHPRYDYFDFVKLLRRCEYIITDGGSNQEECFYLGKPCFLMRRSTERREGIGHNIVLGNYDDNLLQTFVSNYEDYRCEPLSVDISPSKIIIDRLLDEGFSSCH